MTLQKWSGVASITLAVTYIFGFVLFFGVLDATGYDTPEQKLEFLVLNRDVYFLGYTVIGIVFSFALIALVQGCKASFSSYSPALAQYAAVVGYAWVTIVLASSFIFLTSLEALPSLYEQSSGDALIVHRTISIVVEALGGGIELVGAIWVLMISYLGLKHKLMGSLTHYLGMAVGIAGVLTLFSGLSSLTGNPFFEATTAIFGLGQILWFLIIGTVLIRQKPDEHSS